MRECGQAENEEYSSRTKYSEIRMMLLSAEPIKIAGEPCIIAVTTDITEQKRAEKEPTVYGDILEELVDEPSGKLSVTNQRQKYKTEDQEKGEQVLRKATTDIEMANSVKS